MEQAAAGIDEQMKMLCLHARAAVTRAGAASDVAVAYANSQLASGVAALTHRCRSYDKFLTERAEEADANAALLAAVASFTGRCKPSFRREFGVHGA